MNEVSRLTPQEWQFIRWSANYLERPNFLIRSAETLGKPVQWVLDRIPGPANQLLPRMTQRALNKALQWSLATIPERPSGQTWAHSPGKAASLWRRYWPTAAAAGTGAVGGFFGWPGLFFELPATTLLAMRSIAKEAHAFGAELRHPDIRLECLSVLGMGSSHSETDKAQAGANYLATRFALATSLEQVTMQLSRASLAEGMELAAKGVLPGIWHPLIRTVSKRLEVIFAEKMAAQSVPITGAVLGASINAIFADHFRSVAHYHFGLLRLEHDYGRDLIQDAYRQACAGEEVPGTYLVQRAQAKQAFCQ